VKRLFKGEAYRLTGYGIKDAGKMLLSDYSLIGIHYLFCQVVLNYLISKIVMIETSLSESSENADSSIGDCRLYRSRLRP
jgi:hypothetical protein